jgi:hypothetical protein
VARSEKAKASLDYSKQQYERTRILYGEAQGVSEETLSAAQAAWKSDEIEADASDEALSLLRDEAAQDWGHTVAGWIASRAGTLQRLLRRERLLIRIALSPGVAVPTPPDAALICSSSGASSRSNSYPSPLVPTSASRARPCSTWL